MKITKNVNHNTIVAKLAELDTYSAEIQRAFKDVIIMFDNTKFQIHEVDLKIEEPLARFHTAYERVNTLIKGL